MTRFYWVFCFRCATRRVKQCENWAFKSKGMGGVIRCINVLFPEMQVKFAGMIIFSRKMQVLSVWLQTTAMMWMMCLYIWAWRKDELGKKKIEKVSDCIASCLEAWGRICRGKGKDVACQINYKPSWNLHIKVILVCIKKRSLYDRSWSHIWIL